MKNKSKVYKIVKDNDDNELLCPLNDLQAGNTDQEAVSDDCLEKDVAERYSGNIVVQST